MPVYPTSPFSTGMTWPDPIEPIWQMLPGGGTRLTGWKRPDIGLCDRLVQPHFIVYNSIIEGNDKIVGFDSIRRRISPLYEGFTGNLCDSILMF